jgi:uncharacterized protein (TIGR02217 family)
MTWPTAQIHLDFINKVYQVAGVFVDLTQCFDKRPSFGPVLVDNNGLSLNNFTDIQNSARFAGAAQTTLLSLLSVGKGAVFVIRFTLDSNNLYNTSTVTSVPPVTLIGTPTMANEFMINVQGDTQMAWLHSPTIDGTHYAAGTQLQVALSIPTTVGATSSDTFIASINGGTVYTTTNGQSVAPTNIRLFDCMGGSFPSLGFHIQSLAVYALEEVDIDTTTSTVANPPTGVIAAQRGVGLTIDNFREVLFPENISYGSSGGPKFKTSVFESSAGFEQRNQDWRFSRGEYDVSHATKNPSQMAELTAFFYAMQGRKYAFRFKDWGDYQHSGQINIADGVFADIQIKKFYTFTQPETGLVYSTSRRLTKPAWGTIQGVRITGTLQTEGTDYTVDYESGAILFTNCPPNGAIISVDYMEYHIPARFDTDHLDPSHEGYNTQSWQNIPIVEVRSLKSLGIAPPYTKPAQPAPSQPGGGGGGGGGGSIPVGSVFSADFKNGVYSVGTTLVGVNDLFGNPADTEFDGWTGNSPSFVPSQDIIPGTGLKMFDFGSASPILKGPASTAATLGMTYVVDFQFFDEYDHANQYPTDGLTLALYNTNYKSAGGTYFLSIGQEVYVTCDNGINAYPTDAWNNSGQGWRYLSHLISWPQTLPGTTFREGTIAAGNHKIAVTITPKTMAISLDGGSVVAAPPSPYDFAMNQFEISTYATTGGIPNTVIRSVIGYPARDQSALPALSA